MRSIKDKKGFCRCTTNKRKNRESLGLLLNGTGDLVTNVMEKAEVLSATFASIFTSNTCFQNSQVLKTFGKVWSKEAFTSAEKH